MSWVKVLYLVPDQREGLCEGMNLRCKDWLNAVYDKWRNSKKEGTEGEWLRMKWALAMQRRANEWCDWRSKDLKESELPNEQMDWRLKHNLCVFIWRTEGAIPLGSWNEATVREWDLTQRYIVCGRMNWVNETNNQRLGSLVSCEWASLVSDWVSKRRSESDWLNAVYEKWINSKKLCLVRNGKRVLERAKEWSAHTFLCLFPCEWKTQ